MGQSASFRDAVALSGQREAAAGVGREVPLGRTAPVGLPDAADEHDGSVVREVPSEQEIYVPNAPKLASRYATYERAGCYACHKTEGFENLRKPGPILTKISGKLTQDWVKNWIRDPRAMKPSPGCRASGNSNTSRPRISRATRRRSTRRWRISSPTARRTSRPWRIRRAATPRAASRSCARRLPRLPRHRRERSRGRRAAPHVRPAAGEHRQQDDLRLALQLGSRSEALQTRTPTCPTCGSPIRRWPTWRRI